MRNKTKNKISVSVEGCAIYAALKTFLDHKGKNWKIGWWSKKGGSLESRPFMSLVAHRFRSMEFRLLNICFDFSCLRKTTTNVCNSTCSNQRATKDIIIEAKIVGCESLAFYFPSFFPLSANQDNRTITYTLADSGFFLDF
jgi:hypothetical protein